ncbi:MAG: hypothetical protein RSD85_02965, partial [Erysipelotrichaceae bacterium]
KCLVGATMALLLVLLIYTIMNIDNKPVEKDPKQAVVTMKYDVNNPNKAIAKLYKELKEQEMDLKGLTIVEGSKEGTLDIVNSNNESCIKEDAIGIIIASRAYLVIDYGNNEPDLFNINTSSILPIKYNSFNHVRERVDSTDKKHYTKSYIKVELNDKKCYIYDDKGNVVSESKYCSDEQTYISRDKDNNITEERFEDLKDIVDWERTQ